MSMLSKDRNGVSIIIPVYNAEQSLPGLIEGIARTMDGVYEIIAVNDYSRDTSLRVLRELASRYSCLRIVDLAKNVGQENAITAGFSMIRYDRVVCMDDDLQHDPADIPKLLAALEEQDLDLVFARFTEIGNGPLRRMGTWLNDVMMNVTVRKPRGLAVSSFLAMRRFVADQAAEYAGPHPYLAGQYFCLTDHVGNVDLVQHLRPFQQSNYRLPKLLGMWVSGLVRFSLAPLRLLLWIGLALLMVVGILTITLIINRLKYGNQVPLGWTSLMIVVLLIASFQMLALGLMGEYIGRALMTATRYPRYCIRSRYNFDGSDPEARTDGETSP
jgi:undecaprenyl-phosphate 4-deoxy-4-formamido-L-arabinose transferase